ncbi:MAG: hypothetical protein HY722_07550, partial [Planctomycetes bacterium]|nr:hypothetical protein [Planctomycetota bacterium]
LRLSCSLSDGEAGRVAGTLGYLAPELLRGERSGPEADLYALGVMLFEMLTGGLPEGHELPSGRVEGLPGWCDRVFAGAYARRERRFRDVGSLLGALDAAPAAPATEVAPAALPRAAASPPPRPEVAPAGARGRTVLGVGAGALALGCAFLSAVFVAGLVFLVGRAGPPRVPQGGVQVTVVPTDMARLEAMLDAIAERSVPPGLDSGRRWSLADYEGRSGHRYGEVPEGWVVEIYSLRGSWRVRAAHQGGYYRETPMRAGGGE